MLKRIGIVLMTMGLVGCATSETVHLRNADGHMVKCGPYTPSGIGPPAEMIAQAALRDCINDYQRQGYERIPAP